MTATLQPIAPRDAAARLKSGAAVMVDIREPDEFARSHVRGALSQPLSALEAAYLRIEPSREVIFTCRTGMRTGANCDRLAAVVDGQARVLMGGLDQWASEGLPLEIDHKAPIDIMRQVQITAGSLILLGAAIGFLVHPLGYALSAAIGAGLTFAGVSGNCMMAKVMALAPWNRPAAA